MDMRPPLTTRQRQVLDAIRTSVTERGYPPLVRELCRTLGGVSSSTVAAEIGVLEARGLILRDGTARGLTLLDPDVCPTCGQRTDGGD